MRTPGLCEHLETGMTEIDQHQKDFLRKANILIERIRKETALSDVKKLLSMMADETENYFETEEEYLLKILNRFELSDHRERHQFFVEFLRSPILTTTDDASCDMEELTAFIVDWINFHINQLDKTDFSACRVPHVILDRALSEYQEQPLHQINENSMDPIEWIDEFSVGNLTLDTQHKKLIHMINQLCRHQDIVDFESISELQSNLLEHANSHFRSEEAYMEKIEYDELESHKQQHHQFKEKNAEFCLRVMNHDPLVCNEMLNFLPAWWIHHILKMDLGYKHFCEQHKHKADVSHESI